MSTGKRLARTVGGGVLLSGLVVALLPGPDTSGAPGDRGPTVPDRMATYSHLTAEVSSAPPGRGVALFQFGFGVEFLDFPQAVVVGADGDVYRRVDLAEDRAGAETQGDPAPMLLSPDGTKVAVGDHDGDQPEVAILDLATGRVQLRPVWGGRSVLPVAWAPDSRRLAYLTTAGPTNPHGGPTPGSGPGAGDVGLLDLDSGKSAALDGASDVLTVAFAPDGSEVAVQRTGGALEVLPVDGGAGRTLGSRPGFTLAGPGAWSPDGALLAAWRTSGTCPGTEPCAAEEVVSFVDATGGDAPVPAPLVRSAVGPGRVLGWTAPDRVAVLVPEPEQNDPEQHELIDVPLDGREPRLLSALPTSDARYGVSRFHVATGLLPDLEVREAGDPDRGRWPLLLRIATAVGAGALAAGASGLLLRRRRGGAAP